MTRVVFFLIGLLLSVTATLKLWMLMTDPFADIRVAIPAPVIWVSVLIETILVYLFSRASVHSKWVGVSAVAVHSVTKTGQIRGIKTIDFVASSPHCHEVALDLPRNPSIRHRMDSYSSLATSRWLIIGCKRCDCFGNLLQSNLTSIAMKCDGLRSFSIMSGSFIPFV